MTTPIVYRLRNVAVDMFQLFEQLDPATVRAAMLELGWDYNETRNEWKETIDDSKPEIERRTY